jgi:hypothetical protein
MLRQTYAIGNAEDDDIDAFFGTNAAGAKAVADATKKDATAIENFMMIMLKIRSITIHWKLQIDVRKNLDLSTKQNLDFGSKPVGSF